MRAAHGILAPVSASRPTRDGDGPGARAVAAAPARFLSCRRATVVAPEGLPPGAAPEPARYRRCPVGPIADVDCPEWVGARCAFHEDRGADAPVVVPATEVAATADEVARDFLTPRYRRRVRALREGVPTERRGADLLAAAPVERAAAVPPPRRTPWASVPVNVPADPTSRAPQPEAGAPRDPGGAA